MQVGRCQRSRVENRATVSTPSNVQQYEVVGLTRVARDAGTDVPDI